MSHLLSLVAATAIHTAIKVPPADEFSDEDFNELRVVLAEDHGIHLKREDTLTEDNQLRLVLIGENGKHAAVTGQTIVVSPTDSAVHVFSDDEALARKFVPAEESDTPVDPEAPAEPTP